MELIIKQIQDALEKHLNENYENNRKFADGANNYVGCSNNYLFENKLLKKFFPKEKIIKIREFDEYKNPIIYKWQHVIGCGYELIKNVINKENVVYVGATHHIFAKKSKKWINVKLGVIK